MSRRSTEIGQINNQLEFYQVRNVFFFSSMIETHKY